MRYSCYTFLYVFAIFAASFMYTEQITIREKVGYSLGDVAANLVFQMIVVYQLKFYTDIFGLEGAIAGSILLIARVIDAFIDPAVGIMTDHTKSRWGKYRPWILWTALPFSVFYLLAFINPGIEDKALLALYATVTHVLLMVTYSLNNTPYAALGGVMTGSISQRNSLNNIRFMGAGAAQIVVMGLTLPLVSSLGKGNDARGWTLTIGLYAVFCLVCLLITFFTTRERITPSPRQQQSIRSDIKEVFASVSWRSLFVLTFFLFISLSLWGASSNFYFRHYVNQYELQLFLCGLGLNVESEAEAYTIGFSLFNVIGALVQFIGIATLSQPLARRFGKHMTFMVCLPLTALFTAAFFLPMPGDIGFMFLLCILKSLVYAPTVPMLWSMMGDVADHIEYEGHRRATGFCFSGMVFALKAGIGMGGALAGFILSMFGYIPGENALQNDSAVWGICIATSILPALLLLAAVAALLHYPITKQFNQYMQAQLSSRRKYRHQDVD